MFSSTWWDKNKVFFLGLLAAVSMAISPFADGATADVTWKVLGMAIATGVLGYVANSWRGQGMTILGILGNASVVIYTVLQSGVFSIPQMLIQLILLISAAAQPDPKSRGYEQSPAIKDAKIRGEAAVPSRLTSEEVQRDAAHLRKTSPALKKSKETKAI